MLPPFCPGLRGQRPQGRHQLSFQRAFLILQSARRVAEGATRTLNWRMAPMPPSGATRRQGSPHRENWPEVGVPLRPAPSGPVGFARGAAFSQQGWCGTHVGGGRRRRCGFRAPARCRSEAAPSVGAILLGWPMRGFAPRAWRGGSVPCFALPGWSARSENWPEVGVLLRPAPSGPVGFARGAAFSQQGWCGMLRRRCGFRVLAMRVRKAAHPSRRSSAHSARLARWAAAADWRQGASSNWPALQREPSATGAPRTGRRSAFPCGRRHLDRWGSRVGLHFHSKGGAHSRWRGAASSVRVSRSRAMPVRGRRSKPSARFCSVGDAWVRSRQIGGGRRCRCGFRAPARCRSETGAPRTGRRSGVPLRPAPSGPVGFARGAAFSQQGWCGTHVGGGRRRRCGFRAPARCRSEAGAPSRRRDSARLAMRGFAAVRLAVRAALSVRVSRSRAMPVGDRRSTGER